MKGLKHPCQMTHRKTRNSFLEGIRKWKQIPIIGPWPVPDNHPLPYMGIEGTPEELPATLDIADPIHSSEHRGEGLSEDELPQTIDVKEDEERQRIRGATKYAQLGSNAHQRLLQADTAM